jgi:exodeoxyribonuclease V gamma subunit
LDDLPVDIKVGSYRLIGKLGNRYQNGSLFYRYADLKGKDFINAWLHHLIINRLEPQATCLLSTDEDLLFLPEHCQPEYLPELIEIYRLGQQQPDAFFVEPALTYVRQAHKLNTSTRATKSALDTAMEQLARAVEQPYEPELRRLYRNADDIARVLGESFERQCQALLQDVWAATHGQ